MSNDGHARVRVYDEDKDRINELRRGNDTQADVVRRVLDAYRGDEDDDELGTVEETIPDNLAETLSDPLPPDVVEQLDRIEAAATTAEERTGELAKELEDLKR